MAKADDLFRHKPSLEALAIHCFNAFDDAKAEDLDTHESIPGSAELNMPGYVVEFYSIFKEPEIENSASFKAVLNLYARMRFMQFAQLRVSKDKNGKVKEIILVLQG